MTIRTNLSAWMLALAAAIFIVAVNNNSLFAALVSKLPLATAHGAAYLALITCLVTGALFVLFLLAGAGRALHAIIAAMLLVSAICGYFTNQLGVVIDLEMIRNVAETMRDANSQEALELLSWPLASYVLVYGLLPAALVMTVRVRRKPLLAEVRDRTLGVLAVTLLTAGLALPNYKYLTYFSVENRDLRYDVTPIFPLLSFAKFVKRLHTDERREFRVVGADAVIGKRNARPVIGVMVVGETARADHFSLGGYARRTNPLLEAEHGLMYFDIAACGTSTAYSVPCMFSMRGHAGYSPKEARRESNVLDILDNAGVRTIWIDNNSSCKGVCNRIESENLRQNVDTSSKWYSDGGYYDDVLLGELDRYLDNADSDLMIVLHTLGSHGPAYSRRYPRSFGVFGPFCDRKSPKECSDREVANAYDNTILYTDYILDSVIGRLKEHDEDFDAFMLYASDHGESLGEGGVYLHGLPYLLAPSAQTEVPLIAWLSPQFAERHGVDPWAAPVAFADRLSHDNISHTLLGLFDVDTKVYHRDRDIFGNGTVLYSKK